VYIALFAKRVRSRFAGSTYTSHFTTHHLYKNFAKFGEQQTHGNIHFCKPTSGFRNVGESIPLWSIPCSILLQFKLQFWLNKKCVTSIN
jgi:hypothetical protein